jgi:predicted nucleic acid-binding protein
LKALADTTALVAAQRRGQAAHAMLDEVEELWICDVVRLEFLRGALNPRHMIALRAGLDDMLMVPIDAQEWRRAEEIYEALALMRGGRHRGVPLGDVLIAAAAEGRGLSVLHDDNHFELIAEVTDQPMIRLPT